MQGKKSLSGIFTICKEKGHSSFVTAEQFCKLFHCRTILQIVSFQNNFANCFIAEQFYKLFLQAEKSAVEQFCKLFLQAEKSVAEQFCKLFPQAEKSVAEQFCKPKKVL